MFGRFACFANTYGNDLEADQTGDVKDIASRNSQKESNRVKYVSDNQFDSEVVISSKTNVASPPSQQARNEVQQRNDDKQGCNDHAGNLDSQPGAPGKSFQDIGTLLSLVLGHDDLASGEALLFLGVAEVAESQGSRDGHDAGADESLCIDSERDVCNESGAC